jgi:fluoroquinolone transport system permease protein
MHKWLLIIKNDFQQIFRDRFLTIVFVFPFFLLGLGRLLIDTVFKKNILTAAFIPYFTGMSYVFMPLMFGFVVGFIFLEEKDEKLLDALRTIPFSSNYLIGLRLFLFAILAMVVNLLIPVIYNGMTLNLGQNLILSIMSTLEGGILGLFVCVKAQNKVEGLAMFKFLGFATMLPMLVIFIQSDWQYAFGLIYSFWPLKIVINIGSGTEWLGLAGIGMAVHLIYLLIVFRLFKSNLFK